MTDTERKAQKGTTMNETKMTNRDFLTAIINSKVTEAVIDHAKTQLAALDARNEKRKNTPSKTAKANEPIKAALLAWLSEQSEPVLADAAFAAGIEGIGSPAKAVALFTQLFAEGKVTKTDVKVKGKGVRKAYSIKAE